jgi:hypothetical protein
MIKIPVSATAAVNTAVSVIQTKVVILSGRIQCDTAGLKLAGRANDLLCTYFLPSRSAGDGRKVTFRMLPPGL